MFLLVLKYYAILDIPFVWKPHNRRAIVILFCFISITGYHARKQTNKLSNNLKNVNDKIRINVLSQYIFMCCNKRYIQLLLPLATITASTIQPTQNTTVLTICIRTIIVP